MTPSLALSPAKEALLQALLQDEGASTASINRHVRSDGAEAPLSFAQERLWFLEQLEPGRATYGITRALRLIGALDAEALERALAEVVRRHEVLRSTLVPREGGPVQVVHAAPARVLQHADVSALAADERAAALAERVRGEADRPYDLARGPLFRALLVRLDEAEHALLLGVHHAAADGWSLDLLLRELSALYAAFAAGEASPLPEPPAQYADYALWQRERLSGERLQAELDFWRGALDGAPALLELPTDRPRPPVQRYHGARRQARVAAEVEERLRAVGRREGCTLYMVLLAAWQVLLGRYAGQDDVVVGSPIAGRTHEELEGVIGFFANTLALRGDLSGDPRFTELLRRVKDVTLGAFDHQELPFEKLVEALRPERSLSHSPVFQVMFSLAEAAEARREMGGVRIEEMEVAHEGEKFDLSLFATRGPGGLALTLRYQTELFEPETVERMLAQYGTLLREIAADPERRIGALPLLDEAERTLLLVDWNRAPEPVEPHCIHARVERQVERTPDAAALEHDGQTLSFSELNARANRLAHLLRARGLGPETRVGVLLQRDPELVVALLAVLKAGGAYVPLDPAYPADRVSYMLEDSAAAVLVTNEALLAGLGSIDASPICIDRDAAEIAAQSIVNPEPLATPGNLAYVIYTSGSTGRPKGVMIQHASASAFLGWAERTYPLEQRARMLASTSVCFDMSIFELFLPLGSGGTVVLVENALSLAQMGDADVSFLNTVPSAAAELVRMGGIPASTKTVGLGGEPLTQPLVDALHAAGVEQVWNYYAPSETTSYSTVGVMEPGRERAPHIGWVIDGERVYIVDAHAQPAPIGVAGELMIGGAGVTRGYMGRPALTAERYIPDPFSTEPGARMYRTGDRVRWRADGEIEFLGRADHQVKIRGFRVEPGEIESVLRRHPQVSEAVVMARTGGSGAYLAAYVVPTEGATVSAEALRAHVREQVPDYMVPSAFAVLDAFPMTPNGKIDRRALPDPDFAASTEAYAAPATPVEEILCGIWGEVLGVERVGVTENFFALGGHSLVATRVVARVPALLGVELPLRALFERPTVRELAQTVEELRRGGAVADTPPAPRERGAEAPLSFAQERLWFLEQLEPGRATYNIPAARRLRGPLDTVALERALGELIARHESLRTTFSLRNGSPVQIVHPPGEWTLPVEDLSQLPADEREAEVTRRVQDEAARPFDLAEGPLFRARLLRLADDEHALLLSMHHIVSDGWSLGVLYRELAALYSAFSHGGENPLQPLPIQYADFALWQRERLSGDALDTELAYWRERLEGAPALLDLPLDHPRPAVPSHAGARERIELPAELVDGLRALGRREGCTLYMVLLASWQALLGRYAGQDDVVLGSPIAGRTHREVEGLIGFFINTLVLRTDLSGDPGFADLLARVRQTTLGAYEHQELPFEKLVEAVQPERSLSHAPVVQVVFALHEEAGALTALDGVRVEPLDLISEVAKFDISMAFAPTEEGLRGSVVFSTELFEADTIRRLLAHWTAVLQAAVADPTRPISRLIGGTLPNRDAVVALGVSQVQPVEPHCIHHRVERQVARTPEAAALEFDGRTLTFAELNARANRLAHLLRARGVGPETRVGVLLQRDPELVIALLAVLKAGGAYVPLDPAYPADRVAYMLEDSAAAVLVTRESLLAGLGDIEASPICIDRDAEEIAAQSIVNPAPLAAPENLAYVIYTSGSTGRPKGVMIQHASASAFLGWAERTYPLEQRERMLASTSVCFDMSIFELFLPLGSGGTVVLVENALSLAQMPDTGITFLNTVPSAAAELVRMGGIPASTKTVGLGGEPLTQPLVDALHAAGVEQVWNFYAPSETTSYSTVGVMEPGRERAPHIGWVIDGEAVYIVDAHAQPAPIGVAGALMIGGAGVTRGYMGRPALTAERYIPDPFAAEPGARMYRTGDRVRWRADGEIEFLGRADHQVKIRGFRVEPGEVESVLRRHPQVAEAVVMARTGESGAYLAAWVVAKEGAALAPDALRAHVGEQVPDYMVPSAFLVLDSFPLTPNGKIDRRALPDPDFAAAAGAYVAPATPVEEVLAGIWAEVLRVERVGAADDFFDLGGHSLLATRVVSRVREVFAVDLPLRALFEEPTVSALAREVESLRRAGHPALPPIGPADRAEPLPLSFAQERLWFLDRLEGGGAFYNVPAALRLSGALDAPALERALGEIVRRHEALRTVFREAEGGPVQVVTPFAGFALPVEDLSALGEAEREAEVRRRAAAAAERPFDLAEGPLFRAALLRLGAEEHVLLLSMHHIVSDGWSLGVLRRELAALYGAFREGRESPLPEPPVQYADFAAWQRAHLDGQALEAHLRWWKERLSGAPALLELPTDRPRPAVQSFRGAREPVELPAELAARLQALARGEGATLYMVLLAAFQVLLAKYAGTGDVVVGTPIAGRTRGEVEELIGFFANTLPLRAELHGDPDFRTLLRRVRKTTLGAYEHQEVPFEKLVAELQPERSLSHAPLFQAMLILQNADRSGGELPGLRVGHLSAGSETSKFDLTLALAAREDGIRGALEYATDLFDRATIRRMLGHLRQLLEQAAADADARISRLGLMDEAERRIVLGEWNATEQSYPPVPCVHLLWEAQAERTPDAPAVTFAGRTLTYRALNERANRLAHHLVRRGVGPDVRVGICLERGPEMVVSVAAVLKAGGAYVPLDPGYPAARLSYMIGNSAVPVLLTQASLRAALPAAEGVEVVCVDAQWGEIEANPPTNPPPRATPESLAYVIYTSGSTGLPKGVMMPHAAVVNLVMWHLDGPVEPGPRRTVQFAPISFDVSFQEIAATLASGGELLLVDEELRRDPPRLVERMAEDGVQRLFLPFIALQSVAEAALESGRPLALGELITAGEQLVATPQIAALVDGIPGCRLINHYGPTETHVATAHTLAADSAQWKPLPPIGRPVANTQVYVLDAALQPLPAGVPGELYVGGVQVARGYLARPALTAERFVPDPFSRTPGARLYTTGDRVHWTADGELEYLGRRDHQVKVRGFRIEPGEIETVIRQRGEVTECLVVALEDGAGGRRLVAYVVSATAEPAELREHVRARLPEYMVPSAFVVLERMPLSPNGKVDRAALPVPDQAADERYTAPRTPVEEVLAGIWAEVLRRGPVGVRESFFELGGHSLLATRVVSRVRAALGVELPLRALFEGPTVAELAERVEALRRADRPTLPPVAPVERAGPVPLSFAQERLWFLDRLEGESAAYNLPSALRLEGALDVPALERALGEIVRRHEALRTVFREAEGGPVQSILPFAGFTLPVDDLSALGETEREAEVRRRAADDARRPFDLAAGPLFRAALLRLGDEEHVLLLSMHHIVGDGWSLGVLRRELAALYEAFRDGREPPLPELPVQYADYAAWQRAHLRGEALDRELAYWKARLAGAPALLELPTDRPRPAVQSFRGARESFELSGELLERLQALGRREGATLYMVLLAAFQALLSRYSGGTDVVVGSPIAGRTRREVEELIGLFMNTLALRTELGGDPGFRALLGRVREATLGAYEHQEVPFEKLVAELQPERSLSHAPLFQVLFILQDTEGPGRALPGLRVRGVDAPGETSKFDLTLGMAAHEGGLRGAVEYATDLFDRDTIRRMIGHLRRVLEQVAEDPERRLSALALPDEAERRTVLEAWNRTDAAYPAACVHALVEAQAARTPDAVAVEFEGAALTYAELERRANRLAHRLRARGVGLESRVGVLLERGPEMLVALLGVLKAGGAYVPLDPAYPAERIAYMLRDSGAALLLTETGLLELAGATETLCLDAEPTDGEPEDAPAPLAGPGNTAYVIYTSGSTGRPKGVMVEHGGVANFLAAMLREPGMQADDVLVAVTTLSFDIAALELFLPLVCGARVVIASRETAMDGARLAALLRASSATHVQATPATWKLLLEAGWIGSLSLKVLCGGEALAAGLAAQLRERSESVWNLYGPTEATIWSTVSRAVGPAAPTIGRPLANTTAYVLDGRMEPCPIGIAGELLLGGVQVARGYLGRPSLTAEKFIPDPFARTPGARLYRTGDQARWRAEGELEFLGRIDQQVKIRGHRIEPGEIESALREHPAVADAVVVARDDAPGGRGLVAYLVAEGAAPAAGELRGWLEGRLPAYMVPAAFVALEALPLTPNGKIDRKALPAPTAAVEAESAAPRTPVEEILCGIWSEVLGMERVGIDDDFFALGGHSLLVTRTLARLRASLGVELPVRALFEAPTVARLAARVERARTGAAPAPSPRPRERGAESPLSFAQERLWFLEQLDPGRPTYTLFTGWRLEGALDAAALERALAELVRRHESLRTVFADRDGLPVQVATGAEGWRMHRDDLADAPEDEREPLLRARIDVEVERAWDLARGPLFRATLVRIGDEAHALLLSMHHIVSDGWSLGVLFRELAALYAAFAEGAASPLAPLPLQYPDYAGWQRERLSGERLDEELAWWRERLEGAPAVLALPTDRPRPAVRSHHGSRVRAALAPALLDALHALARREGCTLYMVLLAAWQALLGRYAGQQDVVVGTPIAGRTHAELEGLIGFFVNTLALRTDLSGDPTFAELLGRVREATLGAYEHQELPFEKLVDALQPERSFSHSPVFQVLFALQNQPPAGTGLAGLQVRGIGLDSAPSRFDLSLMAAEGGGALHLAATYSADLFDGETVARMLEHYRVLLAAAAADPSRPLSALPLLAAEEERRILLEWNRTDEPLEPACMHALVERQVELTPDAPAVECDGETLTYGELNARANQLAHYLRVRGVGPEVRVALCLERDLELVVGLLATVKAGGVWVPLEPDWPGERIVALAEEAHAAVLAAPARVLERLPRTEVPLLDLQAEAEEIARQPRENPVSGATPANLAYVIFTSGSTGRAKAVGVEHRQIQAYTHAFIRRTGIAPGAGFGAVQAPTVDSSQSVLFPALVTGGTIHVVSRERSVDPVGLRDHFAARRIDLLKIAPTHLRALQGVEGWQAILPKRWLVVGGESSGAKWAAELLAEAGECAVFNHYGPTETTVGVLMNPLADGGVHEGRPEVPLGRPLANTRAYVLDPSLRPVPVGVVGELFVGGAQVARGYLGRPATTADRFVPDPFGGEAGARLYRTGDRARWTAEGRIEYLGRADQQVKIRGFRVEPGEVEAALSAHPAVHQAAVAAWDDGSGARLAAYVVPAGGEVDLGELKAFLAERLPAHMVPSAWMTLPELPRREHGKLDRSRLAAPERDDASAAAADEGPRTPVEEALCGIWAELLRLERVGIHDNFFALGGDSILSIQVVARASRAGIRISPRQLFEHQTVAALAAAVGEARIEAPEGGVLTGEVPLSPVQRWFFARGLPDAHHFNQAGAWELRERVDADLLARALGEVVRHHDALRLRFSIAGGEVRQGYADDADPVPFESIDLTAGDESTRREAADRMHRSLDLEAGPLLRAALFDRGAEAPQELLIVIHHLAVDGVSWPLLAADLEAAYRQLARGREARLGLKTTSYRQWVRQLERDAALPELRAEVDFWADQAADAVLPPAGDAPNTAERTRAVTLDLDEESTRALLAAGPGARHATAEEVQLAAVALAFAGETGARGVAVELEGHGREVVGAEVDLSRTVGWFTARYPVRLDVGPDAEPGAALDAVREQLRRVPRRGIGFGILRHLSPDPGVRARLAALPAPEVAFNYLGRGDAAAPQGLFARTDRALGTPRGGRGTRAQRIEILSRVGADGRLRMHWLYAEGVDDRARVERLAARCREALEALLAERRAPRAAAFTPDDFPAARLQQGELDSLMKLLSARGGDGGAPASFPDPVQGD